MEDATRLDPVLARFIAGVQLAYGPRLDRVVLFGSRARGDHEDGSDYDVAVFLRGMRDLWAELGVLGGITGPILQDTDAYVSAKPFDAADLTGRTRLLRAIREEGLIVARGR